MIYNDSNFFFVAHLSSSSNTACAVLQDFPRVFGISERGANMNNTTQTENSAGHTGLGAGEGDRTLTR